MNYVLAPLSEDQAKLWAWKTGAFFHDADGEVFTCQDVDKIAASGYDGIVLVDKDATPAHWLPL